MGLVTDVRRLVRSLDVRTNMEIELYEAQLAQLAAEAKPKSKPRLLEPDEKFMKADGTYIRAGDIPRNDNGVVKSEWLDENCPCAEHVEKRKKRELPGGMYL